VGRLDEAQDIASKICLILHPVSGANRPQKVGQLQTERLLRLDPGARRCPPAYRACELASR
jgi:hypothetical protein